MSSIAVLRTEIMKYNNILFKIELSADTITFFVLLQANRPFFFSTEELTMYRIHDSVTNMPNDRERTLETSLRFYNSRLICYQGLTNLKVKKLLLGFLLESKCGTYIAGAGNLKPSFREMIKLIYIGMTQPSVYYLRLCVAVLIYGMFPRYVERVRNERTNKRYKDIK